MSTKMKGLLKGLRYISQIFDEEDADQEIQIGYPTDVKHVAHIGSDGPSNAHDTPSWMKEFKSETDQGQSTDCVPDREIKSELRGSKSQRPSGMPDLPRSSRRNLLPDKNEEGDSLTKKETKSRSRRSNSKEYSEGGAKSTRKLQQDPNTMSANSSSRELPDVPKKTRRKKSKELSGSGGASSRLRSKGDTDNGLCSSNILENGSSSKALLQTSEPHRANPIPNLDGDYR